MFLGKGVDEKSIYTFLNIGTRNQFNFNWKHLVQLYPYILISQIIFKKISKGKFKVIFAPPPIAYISTTGGLI